MNWTIFVAFLVGVVIGAVALFFGLLVFDLFFPYVPDDELRPLDAHHPEVMRDAQRRAEAARKAKQKRVQQKVDGEK